MFHGAVVHHVGKRWQDAHTQLLRRDREEKRRVCLINVHPGSLVSFPDQVPRLELRMQPGNET